MKISGTSGIWVAGRVVFCFEAEKTNKIGKVTWDWVIPPA